MSEPDQPNFRVLKIVVAVLGIAILAMTGIIIVTAIDRLGDSPVDESPREPAAAVAPAVVPDMPEPSAGTSWTHVLMPDSAGEIVEGTLSGTVLMIITEDAGEDRRVHLIDIRTGRRIGEVRAQ
ncbi:MAG: hypothetical protein P1U65_16075 [Minwuia sp.]|nr:hypothetical protein [Minwuia sp.]